jgi:hypothetical protein
MSTIVELRLARVQDAAPCFSVGGFASVDLLDGSNVCAASVQKYRNDTRAERLSITPALQSLSGAMLTGIVLSELFR